MSDPKAPSIRNDGLKTIGEIEPAQPAATTRTCPCPVDGCGRCACGHPLCVNRYGGHPPCRCAWVAIQELPEGQVFQLPCTGTLYVVWVIEENLSRSRRVYTVDDEDSELGGSLVLPSNELVKPLPNVTIPLSNKLTLGDGTSVRLSDWVDGGGDSIQIDHSGKGHPIRIKGSDD